MPSYSTFSEQLVRTDNTGYASFMDLFSEQAARLPERIALVAEQREWSYEKLDELSSRLAFHLRTEYGVGKDRFVGVMTERSDWSIICILAIWKAGGAFVPVDPQWPLERVRYITEDTGLSVMLTQSAFIFNLPDIPCPLFAVDLQSEELEVAADEAAQVADGSAAAYVIYTSGTTGWPKGVVVAHSALVNYVLHIREEFNLSGQDSTVLLSSYAFDLGYTAIFGCLAAGGTLHMMTEHFGQDPEKFFRYLVRHRISFLKTTPSLFYIFTHLPDFEILAGELALRLIVLGGEPIRCEDLERCWQYCPSIQFFNHYGPTETTIGTLICPVDKEQFERFRKQPLVGKPVKNNRVFIIDKNEKLVPPGVPGEICIAGPGVARGYLNRPALTAERFVTLPFAPDSVIYKTGDQGKWTADGNVIFLGRKDSQVKIRGYRVELEEIRTALLRHERISEAVILAQKTKDGATQLAAYLVAASQPDTTDLREFLSRYLPDYMIPAFWVFLEKMPVTANGKLDLKALPDPEATVNTKELKAPVTELEIQLAAIWAEVLGKEAVGVDEHFFEIGGDSIKAIQVASRVHEHKYRLEVKDLFQHPTIEQLARELRPLERLADQTIITGEAPLTPIQQRFFDGQVKHHHHYNQSVMLYAQDGFNVDAVAAAFTEILCHHDMLRGFFYEKDGKMVQEIDAPGQPLHLEQIDLRTVAAPGQALVEKANEIQGSLQLHKGPLLKLALFRLADGDRLLIVVHHLVVDGVSWRVLFEDFGTLYRLYEDNKLLVLPYKTDAFKYWAEKLRSFADTDAFLLEKKYWTMLENSSPERIPYDHPAKGKSCIPDTRRLSFTLPADRTRQLLNEANWLYKTTVKDLLLTALAVSVNSIFGNKQVLIEQEGHGRESILDDVDVSRTVGWFTSKYPVLLDARYAADISRQIIEIKEALRKVPNNGIGYGILRYLTSPEKKPETGFRLAPQISFNYLGQFDTDIAKSTFRVAGEPAGNQMGIDEERPYDLDISGMVTDQCLSMTINYSHLQFEAATIQRVAAQFENALLDIISHCCREKVQKRTPSDFLYKKLSIEQLEQLLTTYAEEGVEDVYPLSPMQEGLFYHTLLDKGSTAYFNQTSYRIRGRLSAEMVKAAMDRLFERYDIFRAVFVYEGLAEPVQVILRNRSVDYCFHDFSSLPGIEEKESALAAFKETDRKRLIDLTKGPLVRIAVIQLDETLFELVWNDHHILKDGWSTGIIMPEFVALYAALVSGHEPALRPPHPYRRYLEWLEKQDNALTKKYWETYLSSYETPAGITVLRKHRETAEGYRKEEATVTFDKHTTTRLNQLARSRQITLNTVIQAAWGIFLAKYNGVNDLVFGSVVSGRPAAVQGIESMVGLFINTVPVRICFESAESFEQVISRVQEAAIEGEQHHYLSLAAIQALSPLRQHLLDHILVFDNYPVAGRMAGMNEQADHDDTTLRVQKIHIMDHAHYDFSMVVGPGEELMVRFDYNALVFDPLLIDRLATTFEKFLYRLLQSPAAPVGTLVLTDEKDYSRLKSPVQMLPRHINFIGLFYEQVQQHPLQTALVFGARTWSYALLDEVTSRLAVHLHTHFGVSEGVYAGIALQRSDWAVISMLAVMKAGGAFVPVDMQAPAGRLQFIMEDAGCRLLITESDHLLDLVELPCELFAIDIELDGLPEVTAAPEIHLSSEAPAYAIYTSGTTGFPKGVQVSQRALVNYVSWLLSMIAVNEKDSTALLTSHAFDLGYTAIFGSLGSGGALHIMQEEMSRQPEKVLAYMAGERITWLKATPSLFYMMTHLPGHDSQRLQLRCILLGGEKIRIDDVMLFRKQYPGARFINHYGPTETTIGTIACDVADHDMALFRQEPVIGKPILNSQALILGDRLELMPPGAIGEICIAGAGLASGYLNRPALTHEKFVPHPFERGRLIYRTGDLGKYLPDGTVIFIGRKDQQVKIRGYRVEIAEISFHLKKHPMVTDAVVLAREKANGETYLAAYVAGDSQLREDRLGAYLAEQLPSYMVPAFYIKLPALPVTPNGKLDAKALPLPGDTVSVNNVYEAPATELESQLARIWEEVLQQSPISVNSNFFEIGGHSLVAVQIMARIYRDLQVKAELKALFDHPAIRLLAAHIDGSQQGTWRTIPLVEEQEHYAVSHAQKRLWVLDKIEENQVAYNRAGGFVMKGCLDVTALENAFQLLVDRHEILRTVFLSHQGRPVQKVMDKAVFSLQREYLQDLHAAQQNERLQEMMKQEAITPFDLEKGPLLRARLIELGEAHFALLFNIHHIVSDAWSISILVREIAAVYNACIAGREYTLAPLPLQYKDYAAWQHKALEGADVETHRLHWHQRFADDIPVLDLATDRPRPAVKTYNGDQLHLHLEKAALDQLKQLAQRGEATLFITLMAGLHVLLYKYTGQTDIVLGLPATGREHIDMEDQIGFYINTIACRNQLAEEDSTAAFIAKVKQTLLEDHAHQVYPFDRLVDELRLSRDMGRSPLFDVMIAFQHEAGESVEEIALEGIMAAPFKGDTVVSKFDLVFNLLELQDRLTISLTYNTDLFDRSRMERLLEHFRQVLYHMAAEPLVPVKDLRFVTEQEMQQLLTGMQTYTGGYPESETLPRLFERQALQTPDGIALTNEGASWTYRELNEMANRLAHFLRATYDVQADELVGLMTDRSEWMIIGMLAILKAGGAYVPVDPHYPAERVQYMLQDAGVKAIIYDMEEWDTVFGLHQFSSKVCLQRQWEQISAFSANNPIHINTPDNLAYIIYTSGSTGQPKGVMVEHRNVVRLLFNDGGLFDFNAGDTWTVFHSICFDFSVWEIFGALLFGGRLVIVTKEVAVSPSMLAALLEQEGVTVLNQIPSLFKQLVAALEENRFANRLAVRYVIFGGEALKPQLLKSWHQHYPQARLVNMYGITETTVHVTYKEIGAAEIMEGLSNIGRPIPTLRTYIMNRHAQLMPVGIPGEIVVGGDGVARGYLHREALTQERFRINPYREGERLYFSGDIGMLLENGDMVYLGRKDNQVKVRGFRIELGEIEKALLKHEQIKDVIVTLSPGAADQQQLVAYLTGDDVPGAAALRAFLLQTLPDYMIPAWFISLPAFPLSASGKVNIRALAEMNQYRLDTGIEYVAPAPGLEQQLAAIWQEELRTDKVGVFDNFFTLGGDSLKAIRLIAAMNESSGREFRIADLFKYPSIRELATHLEEIATGETIRQQWEAGMEKIAGFRQRLLDSEQECALLPAGWEDIYPLTAIENGMIYASILHTDEPVYYDQFTYKLEITHYDRFREAFALLMQRHPILRTRYYLSTFEEPVKVICRDTALPLELEDLSQFEQEEQLTLIRQYLREDLQFRLTFNGEILWHVKVFRLSEVNYFLVWNFHHAILDGWSISRFKIELSALLSMPAAPDLSVLEPLKSSYVDYCAIVTGRQVKPDTLSFWQGLLSGYTRNKLPFNYTGKKKREEKGARIIQAPVGQDVLQALDKLAARYNVPFKAICLAAHVYLMHVACGETDIVTGVVSHDRQAIADGDKILGCFLNTVPVRLHIREAATNLELIQQASQMLGRIRQHEIHLTDIAAAIGERATTGNPVFDCILNYTDFHVLNEWNDNKTLTRKYDILGRDRDKALKGAEMTNTLFDMEVSRTLGAFTARIKYRPAYFDEADMQRALEMYISILTCFAAAPEGKISTVPLLSKEEYNELVYTFNDTETPYSVQKPLHALFEEQAVITPEQAAIRHQGRSLTYADLNSKANQLAGYLGQKGIRPGDNVGILTDRTPDMIIGMLGILKAGGAYIPVDPAYPADRQSYILQNSGAAWLLADQPVDVEGMALQVIRFNEPGIDDCDKSNPPLAGGELAYTIYTSGSTGRPKGVMIPHHAAVNLVEWVNRRFNVGTQDRLLFITSMCFDLSVYDIFGMLACGGTIVMAGQQDLLDTEALKRLLKEERITFWDSVPTTMHYLVNELEHDTTSYIQEHLRLVFMSGDWIPLQLPDRLKRFFPAAEVISLGGATEGTVWSNYYPVESTDPAWLSIPYGRPIANNFFYILDDQLEPVPRGVPGELYIGGAGVAAGYANDRERTANAFVKDPFNNKLGGRMYRTGDLGRMMEDGNMEFLGRKDHQTKIRGYRVELGEIESVLSRHPLVTEAVVAVKKDQQQQNYLCAYVVTDSGLTADELRVYLGASLPAYMIPAYIMFPGRLPLTDNGKINRNALPEPQDNLLASEAYVAPQNELETQLAEMWQRILGLGRISTESNFIELGAHSLNISAFVNSVYRQLNIVLEIREVFLSPTIKAIARLIQDRERTQFSPITSIEEQEYYQATHAQKRLWFLHQFDPRQVAYNLPGALELRGTVNRQALATAFDMLMKRHESLRTVFADLQGEPWQKVLPAAESGFRMLYLDLQAEKERESIASRWAAEEAKRPFDLHAGPLLRASLIQLEPRRFILLYTIHHIIADGWSKGVFLHELMQLYAGLSANREVALTPLSLQYKDYAAWQLARLGNKGLDQHRRYWLQQFSEKVDPLQLPADMERPLTKSYQGRDVNMLLEPRLLDALKQLGRTQDASLFMVLLSAVYALLYKITGQEDIVVGSPHAGRDYQGLDKQVGLYLNTLALRTRLSAGDTVAGLLHKTRTTVLGAMEHQLYPFDQLVNDLNLGREMGRIPLFDVWMVLQNMNGMQEEEMPSLQDLEVLRYGNDFNVSRYDLRFTFNETSRGLMVSLNYSTDLFRHDTAEKWLQAFRLLLEQLIVSKDQPVNTLIMDTKNPEEGKQSLPLKKRDRNSNSKATATVNRYTLETGAGLPYVVEAGRNGMDLKYWIETNRDTIRTDLLQYGAILFRGFQVNDIADFESVVAAYGRNLLHYDFASTPRTALKGKIYTSTEYPADQEIVMHNEMAYTSTYPAHLWFYCRKAAQQGGETPLVDSRRMYDTLDPVIRELFEKEQLRYVRHYHHQLDLPWQKVFGTEEKEVVARYCKEKGIDFSWINDEVLQTSELCPAVLKHPVTGEKVWFNQAHLFHISNVQEALRKEIADAVGEAHFPRNVFLGNSVEIPEHYLQSVRDNFIRNRVLFPWQAGDILLVDNLLAAHGRMPFQGEREVIVAMTD